MEKFMKCERCGKVIPRHNYVQKYCKECAKIAKLEHCRSYYYRVKQKKKEPPKEPPKAEPTVKHKPVYTLRQIAVLARQAGMSYGQYVAKMDQKI